MCGVGRDTCLTTKRRERARETKEGSRPRTRRRKSQRKKPNRAEPNNVQSSVPIQFNCQIQNRDVFDVVWTESTAFWRDGTPGPPQTLSVGEGRVGEMMFRVRERERWTDVSDAAVREREKPSFALRAFAGDWRLETGTES